MVKFPHLKLIKTKDTTLVLLSLMNNTSEEVTFLSKTVLRNFGS